jgi:hypothetical protein
VRLEESEVLDRFIDSLDRLDEGKLMALVAAWGATARKDHEAAWAEVRRVAADDGLEHDVEAIRDRALGWAYRGSNIPAMPYSLKAEDDWVRLRRDAAPGLVDAALAVALGHRLGASAREILLGPWLSATER